MLKGHVFLYQIFGNEIAAKLFSTLGYSKNGIFKDYEDEMEVTYNGTEVTVSSGVALIGGRPVQETSSTTIDAGTTSLYCKLCLTVDLDQENTTSQLNQAYYEIVTNVSDYPTLTQDDIVNNNSGKYQFELAQFTTGVSGIDDFVDSRTYINLEEVSGVPTNAVMGFDGNTIPSGYEEVNKIIDEGSNANGNYIKFVDGTMMCWGTKNLGILTWSSWGSLYSAGLTNPVTFPISFISTPVCQAISGGDSNWASYTVHQCVTSSNGITVLGVSRPTQPTVGTSCLLNWFAIGKWK